MPRLIRKQTFIFNCNFESLNRPIEFPFPLIRKLIAFFKRDSMLIAPIEQIPTDVIFRLAFLLKMLSDFTATGFIVLMLWLMFLHTTDLSIVLKLLYSLVVPARKVLAH